MVQVNSPRKIMGANRQMIKENQECRKNVATPCPLFCVSRNSDEIELQHNAKASDDDDDEDMAVFVECLSDSDFEMRSLDDVMAEHGKNNNNIPAENGLASEVNSPQKIMGVNQMIEENQECGQNVATPCPLFCVSRNSDEVELQHNAKASEDDEDMAVFVECLSDSDFEMRSLDDVMAEHRKKNNNVPAENGLESEKTAVNNNKKNKNNAKDKSNNIILKPSKETSPSGSKKVWTHEDDLNLVRLIKIHGNCKWKKIASCMSGFTSTDIRNRWTKNLNFRLVGNSKTSGLRWTKNEDSLLLKSCKRFGVNWTKISPLFPYRSKSAIKNRYTLLEKKHKRLTTHKQSKLSIKKKKSPSSSIKKKGKPTRSAEICLKKCQKSVHFKGYNKKFKSLAKLGKLYETARNLNMKKILKTHCSTINKELFYTPSIEISNNLDKLTNNKKAIPTSECLSSENEEFEKAYWRIEAKLVVELVGRFGINKWIRIEQELNDRKKWHSIENWTPDEDGIIYDAYFKLGPRCLEILARVLPNRTSEEIKARWTRSLKKGPYSHKDDPKERLLVNGIADAIGFRSWAIISSEIRNQLSGYLESQNLVAEEHEWGIPEAVNNSDMQLEHNDTISGISQLHVDCENENSDIILTSKQNVCDSPGNDEAVSLSN